MKVYGYVIMQPPVIPGKKFVPHLHTFAETPAYAWRYHVGPNVDNMDIPTYIQRWHDKGYRVKRAMMEIEDD